MARKKARSIEAIQADIAEYQRVLPKRRSKIGFSQNVADIEKALAAAQAELAAVQNAGN